MKKILLRTLAVLAIIIIGFVVFVNISGNKTFEAPEQTLKASTDSAAIARGKYLAFGPAHCASCHTPMSRAADIDKGVEMPLEGGWQLSIPPGTFRASNLTSDMETGIGKVSDGELVRAMRYSINHRGKMMFPFMPFQEMSDEDIVALISFLRSQPPVKNEIKPTEFTFLGKALMALGVAKPNAPQNTPPQSVIIDSTAEYGSYLANKVANCVGCHTNTDLKTGKKIGALLAGGLALPADEYSQGFTFVTPNLTPDEETGVMAKWSEETFINRFRHGRIHKGSQMPWGSFSRMNEVDLKALYRYLKSVKPEKNKIEKTFYAPGELVPANKS